MEKSTQLRSQAPQSETQGQQEGQSKQGPQGAKTAQLQSAINQSAQVSQLRSVQAAANASPQVQQFQKHQAAASQGPVQGKDNKTGMPDQLKSGIEGLSGMSMDDVKVHYNSSEPAQMQAHAFAQGSDIHIAPGQEQHLAHEAWHVVQQKQGRVQATKQLKGKGVNDDSGLEHEADEMGAKAMQMQGGGQPAQLMHKDADGGISQLKTVVNYGGLKNGCGTKMEADIDHNDVKYGSSPQEQPSWWSNMANLSQGIAYFMSHYLVQGHLLNDNLGGPGVMANMTPITKSANTQMLNFYEKTLKTEVLYNGNNINYFVEPAYPYAKAPTSEELAGGNLSKSDHLLLNNSGYLNYFCDWLYAHYTIDYGNGNKSDSKGLWVKNESNEMKGDF